MNQSSLAYPFMRRAVELILNDLANENALSDAPASKNGKGKGKEVDPKGRPLSAYSIPEKAGVSLQ